MNNTRQFHATDIRRVRVAELDAQMLAEWRELLDASPDYRSPFCLPEWTQLCGEVLPGVEVGLIRQGQELVGLFPFQRKGGFGLPVGDILCDWQTVLLRPGVPWNVNTLLKGCGLSAFRFRSWPSLPEPATQFDWQHNEFFFVDLSGGFESYVESRRGNKRHKLRREVNRLRRRAEEQFGSVELQWAGGEPELLDQLLDWKLRQMNSRGARTRVHRPWVREMLLRAAQLSGAALQARLAVLRFGEQVVALEYYLQAGERIHAWMRAFDADYGRFGPGHLLFWEAAQQLAEQGVTRIDWGIGEEEFKARYASASQTVHSGCFDTWAIRGAARKQVFQAASRVGFRNWSQQMRRLLFPRGA